MNTTSEFNRYWKLYIKYENEILELEELLKTETNKEKIKKLCEKIFQIGHNEGFDSGKITGGEESDELSYKNGYNDGIEKSENEFREQKENLKTKLKDLLWKL